MHMVCLILKLCHEEQKQESLLQQRCHWFKSYTCMWDYWKEFVRSEKFTLVSAGKHIWNCNFCKVCFWMFDFQVWRKIYCVYQAFLFYQNTWDRQMTLFNKLMYSAEKNLWFDCWKGWVRIMRLLSWDDRIG